MKVEDFKSGIWQPQYQYKSFQPVPEKNLLKELTGQQRRRVYVCEPYLKVFVS